MIRHVLIATNGSPLSVTAMRTGVALARICGSRATFVTCSRPYDAAAADPLSAPRDEYESGMENAARERLVAGETLALAGRVPARCEHVFSEQPYQGILDMAQAHGCDLIVLASRGRRTVAGLLVGSQTLKLLTHSTRPVLVCSPAGVPAFRHFLVPTDGSELSVRATCAAIDLAARAQARVTLITCTAPLAEQASAENRNAHESIAATAAHQRLDPGARYARERGVECASEHAFTRHPYKAIVECIDKLECDLVVMASHGNKGPVALLLASETLKVLTHATVPVLVWR